MDINKGIGRRRLQFAIAMLVVLSAGMILIADAEVPSAGNGIDVRSASEDPVTAGQGLNAAVATGGETAPGASDPIANGVTLGSRFAATEPPDPSGEGHAFVDWYLGGSVYDFDAPVTKEWVIAFMIIAVALIAAFGLMRSRDDDQPRS